ncbi:MAG TPA: glutamine synthetase family protein [Vulgatibacter sp.]|nr:glutamine synthetase family protein [Vulgatibacter sp.]
MARKPAPRRKAEAKPRGRTAPAARAARRPAGSKAARGDEARFADEAALAALKREIEAKRIEVAKLGVFDVDGIFRGKYVALDKLWSGVRKGLGFCDVVFGWDCGDRLYDNSRLTGWHTGYPDAVARVDLSTFRPIPWETGAAAFLLDVEDEQGRPHPASPRGLLKRVAARAREMGFAPRYSYEFEFFLFRETPETVRRKGYRNLRPLSPGMFGYSWLRSSENAAIVHDLVDGCRAFRIPIEGFHTETGPGVYEVAIAYDDVVEAADRAALFKTAAKEICSRHGVMACFMAKWNAELPGCSGHVHQSLWSLDGGRNLFFDPKGERGMSVTSRRFLAGQLELMPELTALVAPTVNSYKRYVPGVWAPLNASWGFENRTCALRVIGGADGTSARIEHRQPAADSNPYLTMATLLAAGLYGIERGLEPPAGVRADATAMQAPALPRTLDEAVARLEESARARELLGDDFVDHFVRTRQWEARQYQQAVTSWELERYFEII